VAMFIYLVMIKIRIAFMKKSKADEIPGMLPIRVVQNLLPICYPNT
jgi:hypothetical protein